ncbi:MAG TPA: transcription factor E [Candidatus Deferrimicrobium sp.]|nr:transcription factor E [Candidatus Deferrimicrobium sp.]
MQYNIEDGQFLEIITELIGQDIVIEIVKELNKRIEITDEELASKFQVRLNDIRKILYKLYEINLASFRRLRDKNTGWYIFFWKLEPENIIHLIRNKNKQVLQILQTRLEYEKNHVFYRCPTNCGAYTFEDAMEIGFKCAKCGSPLYNAPNAETIAVLEEKIQALTDALNDSK